MYAYTLRVVVELRLMICVTQYVFVCYSGEQQQCISDFRFLVSPQEAMIAPRTGTGPTTNDIRKMSLTKGKSTLHSFEHHVKGNYWYRFSSFYSLMAYVD